MSKVEIDVADIKNIIGVLQKTAMENKERFNKLDSRIGDGDLGITMEKAFSSAAAEVEEYDGDDIGELLKKIGMVIANKAAATMGTLTATAFLRAGKSAMGKETLDFDEFLLILEKGIEGIKERGKADVGDKTVLDCLVPFMEALKENRDQEIKEMLTAAVESAREGVERTKEMVSQFGRGHYYGEESKGKEDPGAAAALIFLESVAGHVYK